MPEGDTLYKTREALRPDLVDQQLLRVELWGRRTPSLECRVVSVDTIGKHLLIELETGELIRSHLGLHGSWHRYRHDSAWRRAAKRASLAIWTSRVVVVCFDAKEVECLETRSLKTHRTLGAIGPDLLSPAFDEADFERILARAEHFGRDAAPVVDLLLDQRVACGVGNVLKSELLFIRRIHPKRAIASVGDGEKLELFREARQQLLSNIGPWRRTTTVDRRSDPRPRTRLWVYGREQEPCLACGSPIQYERFGFGRRSTYWCQRCQSD